MATQSIPLYLLNDESIKAFDEFKSKHGFEEDCDVLSACLKMIFVLDSDEKADITFLRNGNARITLNLVSNAGHITQTSINLHGITNGNKKDKA